MKVNKKFFIDLLSLIPDENWCANYLTHPSDPNKHCVLGHLDMGHLTCITRDAQMSPKADAMCRFFNASGYNGGVHVTRVNNHASTEFPQPTPKARVLALLESVPEDKFVELEEKTG